MRSKTTIFSSHAASLWLSLWGGVYLIFRALKKKNPDNIVSYTLATIVGIFLMLDSSLQPPVLNTRPISIWRRLSRRSLIPANSILICR